MNREKVEYALADTAVKATLGTCRGFSKVANSRFMQSKVVRNAGDFLLGAAIAACVVGTKVYADAPTDPDTVFKDIEDTIGKWVGRIAALVIVFGGINAGIGIANQDDAGRNRGFMTMAGGAVMLGILGVIGLATDA